MEKKRIFLSLMLCVAIAFASVAPSLTASATENSNFYANAAELITNKTVPTSNVAGKVFAGWYTKEDYVTPVSTAAEATGGAYAKFVDEKVLTVKFQITANTDASSSKTNLRMLTTVDTRKYSQAGFKVEINGQSTKCLSKTVYDQVIGYKNGEGTVYKPTYFSEESAYFMALTLTNIKSEYFNTSMTITPMWITLDGTEVEGVGRTISVAEICEENQGSLATITNGVVEGEWNASAASSAINTYDKSMTTGWNPCAKSYASKEAIVYTLDSVYDLTKLKLTFGNRYYFFDVDISVDGVTYTNVATVNASNYATYYIDGYTCILNNLTASNARYVKIRFTGDSQVPMSQWIMLYEVEAYGTDKATKATITAGQTSGTWAAAAQSSAFQTYDADVNTLWNPNAADYKSNEAITYTLDGVYDLTKLKLTFGRRFMYFDVSVSEDGDAYTNVASINASNYAKYYTEGYICSISGLPAQDVRYVKISFTGSGDGGTWISFYDIVAYGCAKPTTKATIIAGQTSGTWAAAAQSSAFQTYDADVNTLWNPNATDYKSNEAIAYTLDGVYDLTKLKLTFGRRYMYFDVSVSEDGVAYTNVASINASNYTRYYTEGYICSISGLIAQDVRYVKIIFTGSNDGGTWISFYDVEAYGYVKEAVKVTITAGQTSGTWAAAAQSSAFQTYDADINSLWNPNATDYKSNEAITYTLDSVYDLTKMKLTFGRRYMYFDVAVSEDGVAYTNVASINASNYATYYTDGYICTIDNMTVPNAKYVKISFTGSSDGGTWISFYDVEAYGYVE